MTCLARCLDDDSAVYTYPQSCGSGPAWAWWSVLKGAPDSYLSSRSPGSANEGEQRACCFGAQLLRRHSVFSTLSARAGGPGSSGGSRSAGCVTPAGAGDSHRRTRARRILPTYYSMSHRVFGGHCHSKAGKSYLNRHANAVTV